MNKLQISVANCYNPLTKSYENLMKTIRWDDFEEDFHWKHISSHEDNWDFEIYIAHKGNDVLGWAILSKRNYLNTFQDIVKNDKKKYMLKKQFKNLTYLIVDKKDRWLGIWRHIINEILLKNPRIWLSCRDELIPYYKSLWFEISIERCNNEKQNLLINTSKKYLE